MRPEDSHPEQMEHRELNYCQNVAAVEGDPHSRQSASSIVAECVEDPWDRDAVEPLISALLQVRSHMEHVERCYLDRLQLVDPERRASARNLLQYVSLRQQDLRDVQQELITRGLSSLGRCEANVEATLKAVIGVLCQLSDSDGEDPRPPEIDFARSRQMLNASTLALFGGHPPHGGAHIMVTMPTEAAHDRKLVRTLVELGMTCMRINCAHDDSAAWMGMIGNLQEACQQLNRQCRVLMDLAGPKLRTGTIEPAANVLKWRPRRNAYGQVVAAARIWFHAESDTAAQDVQADAMVPVAGRWLNQLRIGDEVRLVDARKRKRTIRITELADGGVWGESEQTAYITPDMKLSLHRPGQRKREKPGRVAYFKPADAYIVLHRGDRLLLGGDTRTGSAARYDEHGQLIRPAAIGCTLPSVFRDLQSGHRVLFDDGRISARVTAVCQGHVELEVIEAGSEGTKLRADKGINFPDTDLRLGALTEKDLQDLRFVAEHADMVGYSFVRSADDIECLQAELTSLGRPDLPVVLKIENRQAFERLPSLLLTAMSSPVSGVMIARGDLAVELGWQRLAEVQEEILWMCEAAHMPVVWATQVLEQLAKTGIPSRAEITDAAMGVRAECVMLNKGPHILEAVRVLSDILSRMHDHQVKKRPLLRRLRLADDLLPSA